MSIEKIPEARKGGDAIRQILSGLSQIVGGTAELRNLYGTGHGRLAPRHARLVVGAGATLSRFLLALMCAVPSASASGTSGTLCHGDGGQDWGHRLRRALMLAILCIPAN